VSAEPGGHTSCSQSYLSHMGPLDGANLRFISPIGAI